MAYPAARLHGGRDMESQVQRTDAQNRALHKYFELVSDTLNEAGLTVTMILNPGIDIEWNPRLVKELLWRTTQKAVLGKNSTTELTKQKDIDSVYDHMNRHLSLRGVPFIPFPSKERMLEEGNV
jgi:hypothetical protein